MCFWLENNPSAPTLIAPLPGRSQFRASGVEESPDTTGQDSRRKSGHVVQDRTGEGLPARYSPGISRTLRKQGASLRRSERNGRPASQGADRIRLTGERHSPISANLTRQGSATRRGQPTLALRLR